MKLRPKSPEAITCKRSNKPPTRITKPRVMTPCSQRPQIVQRTLHVWKDGFSIDDDGELYYYDDKADPPRPQQRSTRRVHFWDWGFTFDSKNRYEYKHFVNQCPWKVKNLSAALSRLFNVKPRQTLQLIFDVQQDRKFGEPNKTDQANQTDQKNAEEDASQLLDQWLKLLTPRRKSLDKHDITTEYLSDSSEGLFMSESEASKTHHNDSHDSKGHHLRNQSHPSHVVGPKQHEGGHKHPSHATSSTRKRR